MDRRNNKGQFTRGFTYRNKQPYWDKDFLINEYIVKGKSSKDISIEYKCHRNNILYWLNKYNINRRNISEIRKNKYWGMLGVDNPMWNKKGESNPNWKGGVSPERNTFYNSKEWKRVCSVVWKRDNATCQRCLIKRKETDIPFHIHHIKTFADKELRADSSNLVLLCEICHHYVHSKKNKKKEFLL